MIISFDLDDTLIPGTVSFATERRSLLHKILGIEKLRLGTIRLMKALKAQGHQIFIYTTSLRSPQKIRRMFFLHGVRIDGVINQARHERTPKERSSIHSKLPSEFGIDLHIDDSKGVGIEGEKFNFDTLILDGADNDWAALVLRRINSKSRMAL